MSSFLTNYHVHALTRRRYVLKDKETHEVLFVVVFELLRKEQVEQKEAASVGESFEPKPDDVD